MAELELYKIILPNLFSGLIGAVIGVCGAFGIKWWEERKRLNGIKNVIRQYLIEEVLNPSSQMISDYEKCIESISNPDGKNVHTAAYEGFNHYIYRANKPEDYYKIYKKKFIILNQIFSMINFLRANLPDAVFTDYTHQINNHFLTENIKESRRNHFEGCPYCSQVRERYKDVIRMRINECGILSQKIKELIEVQSFD